MNRFFVVLLTVAGLCCLATFGCSKASTPITPSPESTIETGMVMTDNQSVVAPTYLLGYYDISFDPDIQEFEAVENRTATFTLNLVPFLNHPMMTPPNGITFNSIVVHNADPAFLGVDVNFVIYHPFPGYAQYQVYDLRGVVIGNGTKVLNYGGLSSAKHGTDLWMKNADGYTRWFNPTDFTTEGILGYAPGGWQNYEGNAQLNPYKYYAKNLTVSGDLWSYLTGANNFNGLFETGVSRRMEFEFPLPPTGNGLKFGYAITASWEEQGEIGPYYPTNAPEAMACKVVDNSDVYYTSPADKGGNLILDISIWDWDSTLVGGVMEDYVIYIESTVLSSVHQCTMSEMTPIGGTGHNYTYNVEIPADNVTGVNGQEYWVIVECADKDYISEFGVPNLVGTDKLVALFRYDLNVSDVYVPYNHPPVITGIDDDIPPAGLNTTVDITDTAVTYTVQYTDPDIGQTYTINWYIENPSANSPSDPPDTMPYDWSPKTPGDYKIWVKVSDGLIEVTGGPWVVTRLNTPPVITDITDDIAPAGLNTVVSIADTTVNYIAIYTDPDIGQTYTINWYIEDSSATNPSDPPDGMPYNWMPKAPGDYKIWVKVDDGFGPITFGPVVVTRTTDPGWAKTWGGTTNDGGQGVATDGSGNIYVTGYFRGLNVDFDPGTGVDSHTSNGMTDIFLSKFDASGNFLWAQTWGGGMDDIGCGVTIDSSGNICTTGFFTGTVDFDPGADTDNHSSNGSADIFLSKFNTSGAFLWAQTWGGSLQDIGYSITADSSDNIYVTGNFRSTVDFDPSGGVDNHISNGVSDVFLSKFDASGTFIWAQTWGGVIDDAGFSVTIDNSDNVYVTGYFYLTVDFDPGVGVDNHTSNGVIDIFLSKFNSSGTFQWAQTWGGSGLSDDVGYGVATDSSNNIYVTGYFMGMVDFNPGAGTDNHTSNGLQDVFLSKFNSAGSFQWAETWGGIDDDRGWGVTTDNSNNIYTTGYYENIVDFDPDAVGADNHTSNGLWDIFLSKFNSAGTFQWAKTWGGGADDVGRGVTTDSSSNIYTTGYFTGIVDFDPGAGIDNHTSNGGTDVFLSKFPPE